MFLLAGCFLCGVLDVLHFYPGGVFHTTFEQLVGSMAMCICRIANLHRDALPDAQDESGVYSALCHEVASKK